MHKRRRWRDQPIRTKLVLIFGAMAVIIFGVSIWMYNGINQTMSMVDRVYATNVSLSQLESSLDALQKDVYQYLKTRSSETLEMYYSDAQKYEEKIEELNDQNTADGQKMLEKNIRCMSQNYLELAEKTVQAKRGRDVQSYKSLYQEETRLYEYIKEYIQQLNHQCFENNSSNYAVLYQAIRYLEMLMLILFLVVTAICLLILVANVGYMTDPLTRLSNAADQVAAGDFDVEFPENHSQDEIGRVTRACNKMMESIRIYISQIRENMRKEQEMKEREFLMETHLKDAQLKYLQAQINPHFLFNSLNAGAQLALLEDADQTGIFLEKMADFFRYNVRKMGEVATLTEELEAVDNYMYIMNVRFAGDIHYEQELPVSEEWRQIRVPSMILQPLVENAVKHGIRGVEWDTKIVLTILLADRSLYISVMDNGRGMTEEQIAQIKAGNHPKESEEQQKKRDSTGIALDNVMHRLQLYYGESDLFDIRSEGPGKGSECIIRIPRQEGEEDV